MSIDRKSYSWEGKKNICIVTFYKSCNYGSNLQAIALSKKLNSMGYNILFLGKFNVKLFIMRYPKLLFARIVNKLNNKQRKKFFVPVPYNVSDERKIKMERFRQENYQEIFFCSSHIWNAARKNGMIFVAGSDIIWNPSRGYPSKFFLDFAYYARLTRFSYASSIGSKNLPQKYFKVYKKYLGSMKEIGVREQSVVDMIQPIIEKKVTKVVDPTLLLNADEWKNFSNKAKFSIPISSRGFVFCYFVMDDPRYWKYVKRIKDSTNKQIIVLPMHHNDEKQPYEIIFDGTPYEFVWLIENSDFICTDSFHACSFSLIFKKEFYLLRRSRKDEDAKYDDFLKRYGLEKRRIENEMYFKRDANIDYTYAYEQLNKDVKLSIKYLEEVLKR